MCFVVGKEVVLERFYGDWVLCEEEKGDVGCVSGDGVFCLVVGGV